jgi:hypothetical protein
MIWTIAESYDYQVEHRGRTSLGVVADDAGSEKLYLHVIELGDEDLAALGPRVDENGNRQHDRLALPRNEEWWVAVEGQATWPKLVRPKLRSCCTQVAEKPRPAPLSTEDLARLRKAGVPGLP